MEVGCGPRRYGSPQCVVVRDVVGGRPCWPFSAGFVALLVIFGTIGAMWITRRSFPQT